MFQIVIKVFQILIDANFLVTPVTKPVKIRGGGRRIIFR